MDQNYLEFQHKIEKLEQENRKLQRTLDLAGSIHGDKSFSLERAENNFRLQQKMLANIGDVILILNADQDVTYCSPNIQNALGWPVEEVLGRNGFRFIHPDDAGAVIFIMTDLMAEQGSEDTLECRILRRDGGVNWVDFSARNLFHDADIDGILITLHDITAQRGASRHCVRARRDLKPCIMLQVLGSESMMMGL